MRLAATTTTATHANTAALTMKPRAAPHTSITTGIAPQNTVAASTCPLGNELFVVCTSASTGGRERSTRSFTIVDAIGRASVTSSTSRAVHRDRTTANTASTNPPANA